MNDFDKVARRAAKLDPPSFFRWLLPGLDVDFPFREWIDTRRVPFPGEPDRTCDTVAAFENPAVPGRAWAVVVEFQSEPQGIMLARLFDYLARLYLELQEHAETRGVYQMAAAVLDLTGPRQPDTLDMRLPGLAGGDVRFHAARRTLREDDAGATTEAIISGSVARCILPWIPLMRGAGDPAIIERWKVAAEGESNVLRRREYAGLAVVLADLADRKDLWERELEGWDVKESAVANEWRAEGRAEGLAEGEVIASRRALLKALELRFRTPVPADLADRINALKDLGELSRWFVASQTADSLEAFRAAIQP